MMALKKKKRKQEGKEGQLYQDSREKNKKKEELHTKLSRNTYAPRAKGGEWGENNEPSKRNVGKKRGGEH